jgi:hypothetical protein
MWFLCSQNLNMPSHKSHKFGFPLTMDYTGTWLVVPELGAPNTHLCHR